jgi:hypothetical protein
MSLKLLLNAQGGTSEGSGEDMADFAAEMPALKPGALIICGVVKKQPHDMACSAASEANRRDGWN